MGERKRILAVTLLGGVLVSSIAAAQSLSATVSHRTVTTEDQFELEITVEGSTDAQPTLPDLDSFTVRYVGPRTAIEFTNGRMSSRTSHIYALSAIEEGEFVIGSATVEIDGQIYSSRPLQVQVLPASSIPARERRVFVRAHVSNTSPYVGEEILFTWRYLRRPRSAGQAQLVSQELQGLVVEDLGEVREFMTVEEGQRFEVSEIRKSLFAQEAGKVVIPPWELTVEVAQEGTTRRSRSSLFDDVFGRTPTQTRHLSTQPIELEVRPLPPPPVGFSGLVGEFDVSSSVSRAGLKVGESLTQEIVVSGRGNVQMIPTPSNEVPAEDFKTYDDKPRAQVDRTAGGLVGTRTFERALVPLRVGTLSVPEVGLLYFDPEAQSYRRASADAIPVEVLPPDEEEDLRLTESLTRTTGKVAVRILVDDLLPIHREIDVLDNSLPGPVGRIGLVAAPPLAFVALLVFLRRKARFEGDSALRRRRGALRRALAILEGEEDALLALRHYVGDRLDVEGGALTPVECVDGLVAAGAGRDPAERLGRLLKELEASRYGTPRDPGAPRLGDAKALLERLDVELGP